MRLAAVKEYMAAIKNDPSIQPQIQARIPQGTKEAINSLKNKLERGQLRLARLEQNLDNLDQAEPQETDSKKRAKAISATEAKE